MLYVPIRVISAGRFGMYSTPHRMHDLGVSYTDAIAITIYPPLAGCDIPSSGASE